MPRCRQTFTCGCSFIASNCTAHARMVLLCWVVMCACAGTSAMTPQHKSTACRQHANQGPASLIDLDVLPPCFQQLIRLAAHACFCPAGVRWHCRWRQRPRGPRAVAADRRWRVDGCGTHGLQLQGEVALEGYAEQELASLECTNTRHTSTVSLPARQ